MMKFDFGPANDSDVVETVKMTRGELRFIKYIAASAIWSPAANRLVAAIPGDMYDWDAAKLFKENH
jgi:hypothetical protein